MKLQTTIANSLSRIMVSLFLTCPTFTDNSSHTRNSAYALALPAVPIDLHTRDGLPPLRQGLEGAGAGKAERSVFERHGDDHRHSGAQEEEAGKNDVMDMFDIDLMPNESELEANTEMSAATEYLPSSNHITANDAPVDAPHDHDHAEAAMDGSAPDPATEHTPTATPQPHGHVHHSASWVPLTEFNETDVLVKHGATPLSFLYYDLVLTSAQTLEFRRTGLSPYGNATTEISSLQPDELATWQQAQYVHGAGSREEDRVMGGDGRPHPELMALHVVAFGLAYFAALPVVLAFRAAKLNSLAYGITKLVFGLLVLLGWIAGVLYKAATPDLYVGHKHNIAGNLLLSATLAIGAIDLLAMSRKLNRFVKSDSRTWKSFVNVVLRGKNDTGSAMNEYERVALANQMDLEELDGAPVSLSTPESYGNNQRINQHKRGHSVIFTSDWANRYYDHDQAPHHQHDHDQQHTDSRDSTSSDTSTLRDSPIITTSPHEMEKHIKLPTRGMSIGSSSSDERLQVHDFTEPRLTDPGEGHDDARLATSRVPTAATTTAAKRTTRHKFARAGVYLMHFFSRGLVVWAYIVSIFGIVVYTGMGRWGYLPSLLAHLIKGSIFFWYGLLTFARYLGAFAEYGWAWNARPAHKRHSRLPSAEMLESFVIFFYGITNTWMERFGAQPGDPYTIKQVQHISIAVMFWFGGLSGMGLESRSLRRLLGTGAVPGAAGKKGKVVEPKSYSFSFNPFPALVIGILGIAMSAHKQDYAFQVTIHALWGYCLAGFSLFRLLTYFFLWTTPPSDSVLPSRPPTEGLAAFCLACGGVLFFLSDEEIAYAAMRHAYDDGFAFLCWTVALVCFIFTWILAIMAIKGWAVERRVWKMIAFKDVEQSWLDRVLDG
ncbi:hypothetical protein QFC22_002104 [Naganishia vaughanmartiniae]|uniref:Uncharacterized protein n=1 Tax=Naganishia vaughanmartiniae TaxID=1424756 RepID=A0ACC2XCZ8_9TREE|nr:hypothetical protein QFC22_002104 [Naganishia vaughanmartiniae]